MARSVGDLCGERGLSAEALAAQSGLEITRVTAIVLGRWTPSPHERRQVAAALGVTIEEIAWGHATPIQHIYGHGPG
jgi:transcriptional regulator with XRE-family HTH domain